MKLLTLTLRNFQGVKDFTLDCQGKNVTIYGDNGAGKTTLASAWNWLLFDKDSLNRKDFEIKTLTPEGEAIHGLEHEVEATIDLDGEQLTLRKVYTEKWTKTRGSAQATFSGHTTNHYIDGVPVSKRAYQDKIISIVDEDVFKLLTNPRYFNDFTPWQWRRGLLLEICGDVTDADVIASHPALKDLPGILGKKSLDDLKAIVKEQRVKVNRDLQQIPTRVSEVQRGLPDISNCEHPETIEEHLIHARAALEAKQAEKLRIEQGGEIAEKQKALAKIEGEMFRVEGLHRRAQTELTEEARNKLHAVKSARQNLELDIQGLERQKAEQEGYEQRQELIMQELREDWGRVDAWEFEHTAEDTCPTCGQAISREQLQAALEKAKEEFNLAKARGLERIKAEGSQRKDTLHSIRDKIADLEARLTKSREILADLLAEEQKLQQEVDSKPPVPVGMNPEYAKLADQKVRLEKEIEDLQEGNQDAVEAINDSIRDQQIALVSLQDSRQALESHAKGQARIEELKAEERRLSKEYEALERQQYLCDEFTRAKVRLLDEKINSRFQLARFKLFEEQVNGGIAECCETLCGGVPWSGGLNNGAQINVGVDIINTLSEHYGFSAPIFADNAESVTQIIPTPAQLIRLVVPSIEQLAREATLLSLGPAPEIDEMEARERWEKRYKELYGSMCEKLKKKYSKLVVEVEA